MPWTRVLSDEGIAGLLGQNENGPGRSLGPFLDIPSSFPAEAGSDGRASDHCLVAGTHSSLVLNFTNVRLANWSDTPCVIASLVGHLIL